MMRQSLVKPNSIKLILILQLIPLILFPPESFKTQEWWLPVLLAMLVVIAVIQLFRHSLAIWPWYLISFAQGFNIISRLMMLMPHITRNDNGTQVFNTPYVVLTVLSLVLSTFLLWYTELPEVRLGLVRE
jgi:bacteriorhodopsin